MFQEALNYPRDSDSAVKNVAIGGLLLFLSFLVVPTFFMVGYVVRSLRNVLDGIEEPPAFDEWGDLFVDGLKAFAIGLAYSLVPAGIAIVAVVTSSATLGLTGPGRSGGLVVALIALGALALLTVVSLVLAYLLPAAIVA